MTMIGLALASLLYIFIMGFLGILIVGAGIAVLTFICSIPKYLARLPRK